jgi:dihydrolipoamide dehydrogenase
MKEGITAVENIVGRGKKMDYAGVPCCVFIDPEMAAVGLTEAEARQQGFDTKTGRFSFIASGKALAMNEAEGFVKVVIDAKTDEVLGGHIAGPHASDLICELVLYVRNRSKADDLAQTIHAHPTLSESVWEAVGNAYGTAIHI